MSKTYIGRNLRRFQDAPQLVGYSRVVIIVSEDIAYSAGTDTGRTLTMTNPWGTQQMAEDILAKIKGFAYQPYSASGAIIDPSAELGDGVTVNDVYSGVYTLTSKFGGLYTADLNAPNDEEIDHEYPYKSRQERKVTRQFKHVESSLRVHADLIAMEVREREAQGEEFKGLFEVHSKQISAKVSKTGGSNESFAWDMQTDHSSFIANNSEVFRIDKNGAEVRGKIIALSGEIGGLSVHKDYLSYNGQTWGGTNTYGMYVGPSGLQLGKNFKVDMAGNLDAYSGTFHGYVRAGMIEYGGSDGYLDGSGLASHSVYGAQIGYNTISTAYTSGGINTSLGYADYANGVFNGWNRPSIISAYRIALAGYDLIRTTISYKDGNGNTRSLKVVGWQ